MRDHLIAHVIGDWRDTRRLCLRMSGHLPGRASIINFAGRPGGRATIARARAACPGSPASQASAVRYRVLAGAGHASSRGQGSMIGRSVIGRGTAPAADGYAASLSEP